MSFRRESRSRLSTNALSFLADTFQREPLSDRYASNRTRQNFDDDEETGLEVTTHHASTPGAETAGTDNPSLSPKAQESTPLLVGLPLDDGSCRADVLRDELDNMAKLALPVVATYLLEMLPGIVSIVLVGHIRSDQTKEYLDAAALAVAFMNLFGMTVGMGLASAMDTLCSQAHGANETHRMGIYLQTGLLVLCAMFVAVTIMFCYSAEILVVLGQPADVSRLAGIFAWHLLPGVPFVYLYELFRKVLQAQNIVAPMLYVAVLANAVNVGLGYWLVYGNSWGWMGAAVARTAGMVSSFLFLITYIIWSGLVETFWTGLQFRLAVRGIPEFLHFGIPGLLQICFEWWAFECLAIICGLFPNAVVAIGSNAILLNVSSLTYMFYLGISISGNVRIGNALGAGDAERARLAGWLAMGMAAATALVCGTFLLLFRQSLPLLFTHDVEINDMAQTLIGLGAFFQLPDSINAAVQGVLRGSGRQTIGAKLNFVGYYILGMPLGCALAFWLEWDVFGLWCGMAAGLLLVAVGGAALVARSDWTALSEDAKSRVKL